MNGENPSSAPPAYGSTENYPNVPVPPSVPCEPPPQYEAPKEGPYSQPPHPPAGYYPPQGAVVYPPGTQPGYPPGTQTVIPIQNQPGYGTVHQTVIMREAGFGPEPRIMDCPNCHALVTTQTTYISGGLTWLSAGLICLFGCWLGCCLIPFCVPELQDVQHRCPNCQRHIGTHTKL